MQVLFTVWLKCEIVETKGNECLWRGELNSWTQPSDDGWLKLKSLSIKMLEAGQHRKSLIVDRKNKT